MKKLTQLLVSLQDVITDYFRYVDLAQRQQKNLENNQVINEYYGEMESISEQISDISDEENDLNLIADYDLNDKVSRIVAFFSSLPNDELLEKEDVKKLDIESVIRSAQTLPEK